MKTVELLRVVDRVKYRDIGLFKCFCGNEFTAIVGRVKNGYKRSCGCLQLLPRYKTHGMSYSREYRIFDAMQARCARKSHVGYKNYGGRGVKVCDRWVNNFAQFIEDMGLPPSDKHTLDRIDSNGDYEPSNCKWSTMLEQQRNRRNTLYIISDGKKMRLTEYAEDNSMTYSAAYMRLSRGQLEGVRRYA